MKFTWSVYMASLTPNPDHHATSIQAIAPQSVSVLITSSGLL